MQNLLKRAPDVPRLSEQEILSQFPRRRLQVFYSVYLGYAAFYLIRKNISIALPLLMKQLQVSKTQMGMILSLFNAVYAIAKLVNGPWCDRSNPRYFMTVGLLGAAVANILFGASSSFIFFALFWFANGYFQSMGSPVGPKTMANWFSTRERGRYYSLWNTCHNFGSFIILMIGGFIVERWGWRAGFYIPGLIAGSAALLVAWKMLDRPESVGLPSIQEYHGEAIQPKSTDQDESGVALFKTYVLSNPRIWILSILCMLIYIVRYGLGDWAVTYLSEVKASSVGWAGFKSSFLELLGIPGTILAGFLADSWFKGKSLAVIVIYLILMCGCIFSIYLIPPGHGALDAICFGAAGFFIYGVQMISTGLAPLEMVPRKAVASAVGLTGAMSYLGAVLTSSFTGYITDHYGWGGAFTFWIVCGIAAILITLILLSTRPKPVQV
jgi:sugar phosphate permease